MGTIRVEAVPVQSYGLGLLRFDHLQLVYQDETDFIDSQDYWYVIEGIQDGPLLAATLGASGDNGRLSLGVANGASRDALIAKIGTPETRGSRIIKSGFNALTLWDSYGVLCRPDRRSEISLHRLFISIRSNADDQFNIAHRIGSVVRRHRS